MNNTQIFDRSGRIAGLAWSVHGPFRDYIQRMSDGRIAARAGAELLSAGEVFFPLDSATSEELRFFGSLEFAGHHGMLAVSVQHPWLENDADQWRLSVVDPFEPDARMTFVVVDFEDETTGTTRLTEAGADVFMGNYPENTLFDPIRIVWAEQDEH